MSSCAYGSLELIGKLPPSAARTADRHHVDVVHPQVPGIYERKWELDSLMNPLDIAAKYHESSGGDLVPFDATWLDAVDATMTVMVEQQQSSEQEAKGRACAIDPWAQRVLFELLCIRLLIRPTCSVGWRVHP